MAQITLPDGSRRDVDDGSTPLQLAESISVGLARACVVAEVDGRLVDLQTPFGPGDHAVRLVTDRDEQGLFVLRHSTAHVLAQALRRIYGADVQYTIGPVIEGGFFYDFDLPEPVSSDDLPKVEAEMKKIVKEKLPFAREDVTPTEAKARLAAENQRYKDEIIDELEAQGEATVSLYKQGEFTDLCRGPHVPHTGKIKALKLMSVAGAYWRGDSSRESLTRIYGTAFFDKKELAAHLERLAEAKKRDHRVLGPALGLYTIDEKVGQGLVLWKPAGAVVRQELQTFIGEHLQRQGYHQVFTPHIGKLDLYRTSGHYPYYSDSQFPPLIEKETVELLAKEGCTCGELANRLGDGEVDGFMLKPMNCPHHIRIYASDPHSYRDLPVRLAEFGTVYRWEQSGELGGMTRVRGFTQDDAHLFVTPEQLDAEVMGCLSLVKTVFETLGMTDYRVRVGLRDPDAEKFVGDAAKWDAAESACTTAAESLGVPYSSEPGEAAFYGPKIDFVVRDVIGREWQLGTVQVDYQLPERFDLSYTGADNAAHRPIMIHRAPFGSMERFIGCLIEHFNGAFPLWLAPEQVRVLPVSDKFADYADEVHGLLRDHGFRAAVDRSSGRVGGKVAVAEQQKIPYMLVVGGKDRDARTVSVRHRDTGDAGAVDLSTFVDELMKERAKRSL